MKKYLVFASFMALTIGCGSSSSDDDTTTPVADPEWSNTEARAVVLASCATSGCHGGGVSPNFSSFSQTQFVEYTDSSGNSPLDRMNGTGAIMPPSGALDQETIDIVAAIFE